MTKKWDVFSGGTKVGEVYERVDYDTEATWGILGLVAVAALFVICALFLPFYCAYRIIQRSTPPFKVFLHVLGIYVGTAAWSLVLGGGGRGPAAENVDHTLSIIGWLLIGVSLLVHIARAVADIT